MTLQAADVSFKYGSWPVLHGLNLTFEPGLTAVIGPNAAGKSTLLKCLCGLLSPVGQIALNGTSLREYSRREISQRIGYLPQAGFYRGELTVFETVLLGRLHDLSWRVSSSDAQCVYTLLEEMSLTSLANRMIQELSGGQAQLVAIAQALIRNPSVLLLDEPTSNLDLRRQFEVCCRVQEVTKSRGVITVMSLHDLNLAARYADRIAVLHNGALYSVGTPSDVVTAEMMAHVYEVDADVAMDAAGRPTVIVRAPRLQRPSVPLG